MPLFFIAVYVSYDILNVTLFSVFFVPWRVDRCVTLTTSP